MEIIVWIVLGLIAGAIAKAVMPGDDPGGIILTIVIGIAGALIGGFLWNLLTGNDGYGDLDIGGIDYARLEAEGPQQWPFPAGDTQGQARRYADGVFATDNGRARFHVTPYRPVAEPTSARGGSRKGS